MNVKKTYATSSTVSGFSYRRRHRGLPGRFTRSPTENLNSLLYLRGVDLAIINSDALDEYRIGWVLESR
jgi:hypothetical protein